MLNQVFVRLIQTCIPLTLLFPFAGMFRNGKAVGRGLSDMPRKKSDGGDRDFRGEDVR